MLYTVVPCSKQILAKRGQECIDFWHWLLIYNDISRRLSQDKIDLNDVPIIERLIETSRLLVPKFIKERNSTFNIHATKHMPKYVRLLGPVQNYSAFAFGGFNGLFVRFVTSAFGSLNQIADRLALQQYCGHWIAGVKKQNLTLATLVAAFDENRPFQFITDHLYVDNQTKIDIDQSIIIERYLNVDKCTAFARARKGSTVLHSLAYGKRKSTCSYIGAFYNHDKMTYGEIQQFIVNGTDIYAYIRSYDVVSENISADLAPLDEDLKKIWRENIYGSFFKTVNLSDKFALVHLDIFTKLYSH